MTSFITNCFICNVYFNSGYLESNIFNRSYRVIYSLYRDKSISDFIFKNSYRRGIYSLYNDGDSRPFFDYEKYRSFGRHLPQTPTYGTWKPQSNGERYRGIILWSEEIYKILSSDELKYLEQKMTSKEDLTAADIVKWLSSDSKIKKIFKKVQEYQS